MNLNDYLSQNLLIELHTAYRPVFDLLTTLETEFNDAAKFMAGLAEPNETSMLNAQANLLFSMQGLKPTRTRREVRDAMLVLTEIPGTRSVLAALIVQYYSGTIYMLEHLFFLNRESIRRVTEQTPDFKGRTLQSVSYPPERVDEICILAYKIWKETKQHVPQDASKE